MLKDFTDYNEISEALAKECHMLREQFSLLRVFYSELQDDDFKEIVKGTNDFWVPVLKSIDDSVVTGVTTLLGDKEVNGITQLSFNLLFTYYNNEALFSTYNDILKENKTLIKKLRKQRNNYSAHKRADKIYSFDKNIEDFYNLLNNLKSFSESIVTSIHGGGHIDSEYAKKDFLTIKKRLLDSQKFYRLK